jgi:hypothetical protein
MARRAEHGVNETTPAGWTAVRACALVLVIAGSALAVGSVWTAGATATEPGAGEPDAATYLSGAADVAAVAQSGGEAEPNDDPANATRIATGREVTGRAEPGDGDWFAFGVLREGQAVTATVAANGSALPIYLFAPGSGVVDRGFAESGSPLRLAATANGTGTYYLLVRAGNGSAGSYTLSVAVSGGETVPPDADLRTATVGGGAEGDDGPADVQAPNTNSGPDLGFLGALAVLVAVLALAFVLVTLLGRDG